MQNIEKSPPSKEKIASTPSTTSKKSTPHPKDQKKVAAQITPKPPTTHVSSSQLSSEEEKLIKELQESIAKIDQSAHKLAQSSTIHSSPTLMDNLQVEKNAFQETAANRRKSTLTH